MLCVIICLSFTFSLLCGVGNALEENEIIVSVVLTSQTGFPGSGAVASIFLVNNSTEILTIQYVGINFDWMPSDQFLGHNLSEDPVFISSSTNHIFQAINIIVPPDTTLGEHNYSVGIDGLKGTEIFSWNSQNYIFVVKDSKKQTYDDLLSQVSSKITESKSVNYESSTAQSLVEQAEVEYVQALVYGNQNSWDEAVSRLNSASSYLEQADVEEQKYLEEKSSQENLLIIIGLVVVIIIAILVVFYLVRRKKDKILIQTKKNHIN